MTKKIRTGVLICVWSVGLAAFAVAAEPVGTITFVEGVCDIARNDAEPVLATEGAAVYLHDRVRTKSYSKARIELKDTSVLKLAPSSCITVDEFLLTGNTRQSCQINLFRGKVQAIVSKTGLPDTFCILTPNTRGAVKGSEIFVSYLAGRTAVFVQSGSMTVNNPAHEANQVSVNKGECVFVEFERAPGDVRTFLDVEMTQHKRDVEPHLIKKWIPARGAAEMNAVVVSFTGEVRIFKKGAGDWRPVRSNETIAESDKVQTAEGATAEIRLANGNALYLKPNTELGFSTLRYDPKSGEYENSFDMSVGEVIGVVEKLGNKSTFQLRTPTAVSGVRGTVIRVVVAPPTMENPLPQTQVFFEGGLGMVTSLTTGQTQQLFAGQNVVVNPEGKISAPLVTLPEQKMAIVQGLPMQQPVHNYMPGKPMAGPGPDMAKPPLPPPPPIKEGEFGLMPPPPPPPLPFDQVFPPNVLAQIPCIKAAGTDPAIILANLDLTIKIDGTWSAQIKGDYNTPTSPGWDLRFTDAVTTADRVEFNDIPDSLSLVGTGVFHANPVPSTFVGTIVGTTPDKSLTLNSLDGNYAGSGAAGTFSATAWGTWHDQ